MPNIMKNSEFIFIKHLTSVGVSTVRAPRPWRSLGPATDAPSRHRTGAVRRRWRAWARCPAATARGCRGWWGPCLWRSGGLAACRSVGAAIRTDSLHLQHDTAMDCQRESEQATTEIGSCRELFLISSDSEKGGKIGCNDWQPKLLFDWTTRVGATPAGSLPTACFTPHSLLTDCIWPRTLIANI